MPGWGKKSPPLPETVQVPTESEDVTLTRKEKCMNYCKKFLAFLFSTIGLTCLLVGYTILGGLIFMKLEAENEELVKSDLVKVRAEYVQHLWNITEKLNVLHEQNWSIMADAIFREYTKEVYQATKNKGWDGKDKEAESQWTFAGAMLYCITVITTIGKCHHYKQRTSLTLRPLLRSDVIVRHRYSNCVCCNVVIMHAIYSEISFKDHSGRSLQN